MADVGSFLEEEHMAIFEGAGVAIVTPFKENGEISFDKLDELIEEQIAGHTDCIVSMGTPWACSWLTKVCRQECGVSGLTPGTDFSASANLSRKCVGLQGLSTPLPVQR